MVSPSATTRPPGDLHDDQDRSRHRAALWISLTGIGSSAVSMVFDRSDLTLIKSLVIAILSLNILLVLRHGHTFAAAIVGLFTAAVLVLLTAALVGVRGYFWMLALPPVAYFMLGVRAGTVTVAIIGTALVVQLGLDLPEIDGERTFADIALSYAMICAFSAIAENARARYQAKLERTSSTDPLTGLANRRACEAAMRREASLVSRGVRPASLVMFDVDRFKSINDRFGHAGGDLVLIELAEILRTGSRTTDLAGRWGGEELICVLAGTDREGARVFAERICQSVRTHAFVGIGQVTLSAGIAEIAPGPGRTVEPVESWVLRADQAMYRAKSAGRDRIELATT